MKFSNVLFLAATAFASPLAMVEDKSTDLAIRQGSNLATVVLNSVNTAAVAVNASLATTQQTIVAAGNNINAQVQATIEANIEAIAQALAAGAAAITGAIAAGGGDIAGQVANFGAIQIAQLKDAIDQLLYLLKNLGVSLRVIIQGVGAVSVTALQAIRDELAAVQNAIGPFVAPIGDVVHATQGISAAASVALQGFDQLVPGAVAIVNNVISSS